MDFDIPAQMIAFTNLISCHILNVLCDTERFMLLKCDLMCAAYPTSE